MPPPVPPGPKYTSVQLHAQPITSPNLAKELQDEKDRNRKLKAVIEITDKELFDAKNCVRELSERLGFRDAKEAWNVLKLEDNLLPYKAAMQRIAEIEEENPQELAEKLGFGNVREALNALRSTSTPLPYKIAMERIAELEEENRNIAEKLEYTRKRQQEAAAAKDADAKRHKATSHKWRKFHDWFFSVSIPDTNHLERRDIIKGMMSERRQRDLAGITEPQNFVVRDKLLPELPLLPGLIARSLDKENLGETVEGQTTPVSLKRRREEGSIFSSPRKTPRSAHRSVGPFSPRHTPYSSRRRRIFDDENSAHGSPGRIPLSPSKSTNSPRKWDRPPTVPHGKIPNPIFESTPRGAAPSPGLRRTRALKSPEAAIILVPSTSDAEDENENDSKHEGTQLPPTQSPAKFIPAMASSPPQSPSKDDDDNPFQIPTSPATPQLEPASPTDSVTVYSQSFPADYPFHDLPANVTIVPDLLSTPLPNNVTPATTKNTANSSDKSTSSAISLSNPKVFQGNRNSDIFPTFSTEETKVPESMSTAKSQAMAVSKPKASARKFRHSDILPTLNNDEDEDERPRKQRRMTIDQHFASAGHSVVKKKQGVQAESSDDVIIVYDGTQSGKKSVAAVSTQSKLKPRVKVNAIASSSKSVNSNAKEKGKGKERATSSNTPVGTTAPSKNGIDYSVYKGRGRYATQGQSTGKTINSMYAIDPSKNGGLDFQYDEVVRKKADRKKLDGGDCECCREYYEAIGPAAPRLMPPLWRSPGNTPAHIKNAKPCTKHGHRGPETDEDVSMDEELELDVRSAQIAAHKKDISRHRQQWKRPTTPPGYWNIGFPSTQETEDINEKAREIHRKKQEEVEREVRKGDGKYKKRNV